MCIAEAAIAAFEQHDALAGRGQVRDHRLIVLFEDLRAGRHFQHYVGAAWPVRFLPMPWPPFFALKCCL